MLVVDILSTSTASYSQYFRPAIDGTRSLCDTRQSGIESKVAVFLCRPKVELMASYPFGVKLSRCHFGYSSLSGAVSSSRWLFRPHIPLGDEIQCRGSRINSTRWIATSRITYHADQNPWNARGVQISLHMVAIHGRYFLKYPHLQCLFPLLPSVARRYTTVIWNVGVFYLVRMVQYKLRRVQSSVNILTC